MANNHQNEEQVPMIVDNDENSDSGSDPRHPSSDGSGSPASESSKSNSASSDSSDSESEESDTADSTSAVDRGFRVFTENSMGKLDESNPEYKMMKAVFIRAMGSAGGDTDVVAIHKNIWSDLSLKSRFKAYRMAGEAVAKKNGRNPNLKEACVRDAWYGGSKEEIVQILAHGFSGLRSSNQQSHGVGVHLNSLKFGSDGALLSSSDDTGLKHILLCRAILGKVEVIRPGSKQSCPSSKEMDSGTDDLVNPRNYIVWNAFMNSRIIPTYVFSFKVPLLRLHQPKQQIPSGVQAPKQQIPIPSGVQTNMQITLSAKTKLQILKTKQKIALGAKTKQQKIAFGAKTKQQKIALGAKTKQQKIVSGDRTKQLIAVGVRLIQMIVSGIQVPPSMGLGALMYTLERHLPRSQMQELARCFLQFRRNKITRQQLVEMVRQIVGDSLLMRVIKSYHGKVIGPGKPRR